MMSSNFMDVNPVEVNNAQKITSNKGFSLIELIVCVAILAIAVIPLMKSMSVASSANGKAQKRQNATSLAESIMEEVKSSGISDLQRNYNGSDATTGDPVVYTISQSDATFWDATNADARKRADWAKNAAGSHVNDSGTKKGSLLTGDGAADLPYYVLYIPDATATSGQTFDATVSIRTTTYGTGDSELDPNDDTKDDNVGGANIVKLPIIEELDPITQAVLSPAELTKYDEAALDYFNQKKATYGMPGTDPAQITKKIINIKKSSGVLGDVVKVECTVTYEDDSSPTLKYTKNLYTGTYTQQTKEGTTEKEPLNNSIYIFYRATQNCEEINIEDTATIGEHKVYLVMSNDTTTGQRITDISGTTINYKKGSNTITLDSTMYGDLYEDDRDGYLVAGTPGDADYIELITNLGENAASEGRIYKTKSTVRIYDITVELTKPGDDTVYALLTSTDSAQ